MEEREHSTVEKNWQMEEKIEELTDRWKEVEKNWQREGSIAERTDGWRINDHAVCPDFSVKVRGSLGETAGHEIEIFRHGRVDLINETEERGGIVL